MPELISLRIGIDFDNTLASYSRVFVELARERRWLPAGFRGGKAGVRDHIRDLDNGEMKWRELQALAYGPRIGGAELTEGAATFVHACRQRKIPVFVISHKTRKPAHPIEGVDLHAAAMSWMQGQGFFDVEHFGLTPADVFFEVTREMKLRRIEQQGCTHFIDDLVEVFEDAAFPRKVQQILYAPEGGPASPAWTTFSTWRDIQRAVLDA